MKELVGQKVYLIGTGNLCYQKTTPTLAEAVVEKVAKVNITLVFGKNPYVFRMGAPEKSPKAIRTKEGNSGYLVFESERDRADFIESRQLASGITNEFSSTRDFEQLDVDTLRKLSELLGTKLGAVNFRI